jgi:hypothetical protein
MISLRKAWVCLILGILMIPVLSAQSEGDAGEQETQAPEQLVDSSGIVYPKEQPGLIYVEAEDAVSTNFAQQAILDYSSSGQRMLQLNRFTALGAGQRYFAEYVFWSKNPAATNSGWLELRRDPGIRFSLPT